MKTYVIEDLSDDDLLSLLISEAHECSVPSESNTLASIREELKLRLTKRAADSALCAACGSREFFMNEQRTCVQCKTPSR